MNKGMSALILKLHGVPTLAVRVLFAHESKHCAALRGRCIRVRFMQRNGRGPGFFYRVIRRSTGGSLGF